MEKSDNLIVANKKYKSRLIVGTGKYRNFESGTSINECIDCSVGFYSLEKSAPCSPCEEGKFGSLPSQSKCDFCNEGKYSPLNATITCESCPSNSESNSENEIIEQSISMES